MWELLFLISFVINIGLLVYFLRPREVVRVFEKPPPPNIVVGYYDGDLVTLKQAEKKSDFSDVFDSSKGWRNLM